MKHSPSSVHCSPHHARLYELPILISESGARPHNTSVDRWMIAGATLPASTSRFINQRVTTNAYRWASHRTNVFNEELLVGCKRLEVDIEVEGMSKDGEDQLDVCRSSFEEEYLQEYLDRVADIVGISRPKYRINFGSKTGDNYVAVVYRVSIEGEKSGAPAKVQTIFKVPPKDEAVRLMMQIGYFFPREHVFYTEIVPAFEEFLRARNKSLNGIPKCYLSSPEDHKEVICLEDLRVKGFVMRDRMKQMDCPHISLAMRALGRLHALSFALRDQRPDVFASKITTLEEPLYRPEVITNTSFSDRFEKLSDLVKTALAEDDPKYTERFSEYLKTGLSNMEWCCSGSAAEPYAVLGHGDFWMNNMLFKYDEGSTEPKDIYLLDFQLARYASPVIDISYVLFCNCSLELRQKHFDELIKIYHESLSAYLSELGSDPQKLFPFDALLDQIEKFSINGAGMAVLVLPIFTSQGEDDASFQPENGDIPALQDRIHRDHFWRNTTRDTFKDLIDRNYI